MAHPLYSPNLTPSDYHLFGPLKWALSERSGACMARCSAKKVFYEGIRSLCNNGPRALKSMGLMLKNDVNVSFLFVLK
jgi:hypothetical protein